jgi:hypothetical protein
MVNETYGTDEALQWDDKTKTATINGVSFKSGINGVINNNGSLMLDSSVFARMMGLSNRFGSYNSSLTEAEALKALRSEYANSVVWDGGFKPKGNIEDTVYYFLDFLGYDIDIALYEHTIHVSNNNGDARSLILGGGAEPLAIWIKDIYKSTYRRDFDVATRAISVELLGHAAPDKLIDMAPIPVQGLLKGIKGHSDEADIGEPGHERWWERAIWDTLGIATDPAGTGFRLPY